MFKTPPTPLSEAISVNFVIYFGGFDYSVAFEHINNVYWAIFVSFGD